MKGEAMSDNIFSRRLNQVMKEKNLRQIDIIRAAEDRNIKLGKSHISQYVSGKTVPRDNIIRFLSELLDTDENWLRGNEQNKNTISETGESIMREFKKSTKLDNVLYDVRGPVVDEAARMEEAGTQVLKLNIGNPAPFGFRTPDEVIYDMKSQLTECEGYSPAKGLFSARKAIMQYAQNRNIPNVTIEDIRETASANLSICRCQLFLTTTTRYWFLLLTILSGQPALHLQEEKQFTISVTKKLTGTRILTI